MLVEHFRSLDRCLLLQMRPDEAPLVKVQLKESKTHSFFLAP